jgi:hypothetical protein
MARALYSIDIKLCATAYIVAESAEEATEQASLIFGVHDSADLPTGDCGDFEITGESFHADMPEVSLSPAVTFYGPWEPGQTADLVEEFEAESDDGDED